MYSQPNQIAIVGENCIAIRNQFHGKYLPNTLFYGSTSESKLETLANKYKEGQTLIYFCKNKRCLAPTKSVSEVMKILL
jgi:uncharacterized protein YyaL (SSP411 family)